ncbi:helix-turn-helix transcriptional regulator [Pseudooceanicola sp. CBS1P-1]|uniref:Helix-turn-helix domain-containing protein n=1 Tax=Pseudooceanicola albus TaxID=2692189 RepID=A0A6L7G1R3_9RHOB|nr:MULTISPECIES: helix-turn-helix transcriptional regulator [Pseudooceanicola]MBT9383808.1 helix-turn-helix transcriptional regulator [Pseudooceanicola endophyticus]MXN17662.1 helix-turn-helix domain-containing protein [Pseudooceanicola albus]
MSQSISAPSDLFSRIARIEQAESRLVSLASDYPQGTQVHAHSHPRHQLMHALSGVVHVRTGQGSWMVPPDSALWIPAGCVHSVDMFGAVQMRSTYLRPSAGDAGSAGPRVLAMNDLARALILAVGQIADIDNPSHRDTLLMELLIEEIARLEDQPLALPLPNEARLFALCQRFLQTPGERALDEWAAEAAMSRRNFTRRFREQTGLSPDRWRQQASVISALPRLSAGEPVTRIALDLGYESPAAFTTMFRRLMGCTPRAWRARPKG